MISTSSFDTSIWLVKTLNFNSVLLYFDFTNIMNSGSSSSITFTTHTHCSKKLFKCIDLFIILLLCKDLFLFYVALNPCWLKMLLVSCSLLHITLYEEGDVFRTLSGFPITEHDIKTTHHPFDLTCCLATLAKNVFTLYANYLVVCDEASQGERKKWVRLT